MQIRKPVVQKEIFLLPFVFWLNEITTNCIFFNFKFVLQIDPAYCTPPLLQLATSPLALVKLYRHRHYQKGAQLPTPVTAACQHPWAYSSEESDANPLSLTRICGRQATYNV